MSSRPEGFVDALCHRQMMITWIFAIAVAFTLIQLPYLLVEIEPETAVVVTMNVVGFTAFAAASGLVLVHCRRRERSP